MHDIENTSVTVLKKEVTNSRKKIQKLQETLRKSNQELIVLRKKLKKYRTNVDDLKKKIKSDNYRESLLEMFTEDQVKVLITKKSPKQWSNDTLQRALKLRLACGKNGYEEIKKSKCTSSKFKNYTTSIRKSRISTRKF